MIRRRDRHAAGMTSQSGFSLLELAVVLVVLGVVTVLLVRFLGTAARERHEFASAELLARADSALLAFAMINSRLPCPDSDGNGDEDCGSGEQVGRLPYKTVGLPDANARKIRYGVLRHPDSSAQDDADLARSRDRYYPLHVGYNNIASEIPLGTRNGLDLCWALRTAQDGPADPAYLHVTRPQAPTEILDNIAYAVALPRGGDAFSGRQATDSAAFDSPRRPTAPDFHDRVLAVGLDQLWTRMHCGGNVAAAGHAHFNAAASIAIMDKALKDYKKQLEVSVEMAEAGVTNGEAAIAGGVSAIANAGAGMSDAISEGLASTGVVAYKVGLAATGVAAGVGVTITAAFMKADADTALDSAKQAVEDVQPLIDRADPLRTTVNEHAEAADSVGLY